MSEFVNVRNTEALTHSYAQHECYVMMFAYLSTGVKEYPYTRLISSTSKPVSSRATSTPSMSRLNSLINPLRNPKTFFTKGFDEILRIRHEILFLPEIHHEIIEDILRTQFYKRAQEKNSQKGVYVPGVSRKLAQADNLISLRFSFVDARKCNV